MEAAAQRWPVSSVRRIRDPFDGIGLRLPEPDPTDPPQYIMVVEFEDELPAWTTLFPALKFVCVSAQCWGTREYYGYVCQNGTKVAEDEGDDALTRLMAHLGVTLPANEHFAPFERSYPW
jgi:hypothetical protein